MGHREFLLPRHGRIRPEIGLVPLGKIHPSPDNDGIYRPADPADPDLKALAGSAHRVGKM
jgi:hypothetical protein